MCNFINSDMSIYEEDYEDLIKRSLIGKFQFQLKYIFTKKLIGDEIKTIEAKNDSIEKVWRLTHDVKSTIVYAMYNYNNNFKNEEKELMKLYKKLPDFRTKKYDVYILDNLPPYGSICMRDIEGEIYDIRNRIKGYLQEK